MKHNVKYLIVLFLFALSGGLTVFCQVERHAQAKAIGLSAIPTVIGEWRMVKQDTTLGAKEEKFLDDVLIRTYQRPDGKKVMLAIAFGADQRKKFSIHLPEVCYKASGSYVTSVGQSIMNSPNLILKQMFAKNPDGGVEAVQYWVVLDGKVVTSDFDQKLKHAYYGIFGADTGGTLVRVSSSASGRNVESEFKMQVEFISFLYQTLRGDLKNLIFGKLLRKEIVKNIPVM